MNAHSSDGTPPSRPAPGGPGCKPHWSPAAKSGVGCAITGESRLWFTLGSGIVTEMYHPRLDQAAIRDLGMVVTASARPGADESGFFFSEEKVDCTTDTRMLAPGVPAYEIVNTCARGRYRITKRIIADPARDALLQRVEFVPLVGTLADYRLCALLSPRLGDQGADNTGWVANYRQWPMLFASRDDHALAMASSAGWAGRSVGYVGASDAWQDLRRHGRLTWHYDRAERGHIALAGEIDLQRCGGVFFLAVAFDREPDAAGANAALALSDNFDAAVERYIHQWNRWQHKLTALDDERSGELLRDNADQRRRSDRSRPRPSTTAGPESSNLYRTSTMVLHVHRSKRFRGAGVASLTTPWGEARDDESLGGYHLVWARDLVEEASGMLAAGATAEAVSVLDYLRVTQLPRGGWAQDMWLDGTSFSDGVQLDEAALPIVLLDLLRRESALSEEQLDKYWPMVRAAAAYMIRSGPSTGQDRWENTPGLSPYTLATEIAALLVAAGLAERFGEPQIGAYFRQTADLWNESIEPWTYVTDTPLARQVGVEGYYVRIAPAPGMHAILSRGASPSMKQARDLPYTRVVSADALALVRFGLRSPADPRIVNTVKVVDAMTRVELPAGPSWRRYNGGYYGESDEGEPFTPDGKSQGHGRCWPLLTGERGHYELAAGRADAARKMLAAMGGFASQVGLLPEQVWDVGDLPERDLYRGRPSGSAMPLAWTHAEYIRLLRSIRDGKVFDRPHDTWQRYVHQRTHSDLELWRFDHQPPAFFAGRRLRIETAAPAIVHFSTDRWKRAGELPTRDIRLGFHVVDLPTADMQPGQMLAFTFRWPEANNRWEGRDFQLTVETPPEDGAQRLAHERPAPARKYQTSGGRT